MSPPIPAQRPGEAPPALPAPLEPKRAPAIEVRPAPEAPRQRLDAPRLLVRAIALEGNTVLDGDAIAAVTARYAGREIDADELESLRTELTRQYVDLGYVNSGVIVPDQDVENGVLRLRAIEGTLSAIEIRGEELRLRPAYLASRLQIGAGRVLNLNSLREAITILQQDGLIEQINAELVPGLERGEAALQVQVVEAVPYQAGMSVSNHRNPAVGEYRAELFALHNNLTGWGDRLEAHYGATSGLTDFSLGYSIPVNARGTSLAVSYSRSDSSLIQPAIRALDIANRLETTSFGIEHPLLRTSATTLSAGAIHEWRRSDTSLLQMPFSFTPGIPDGKARAGVTRLSANWLLREAEQVFAARLQLSVGNNNADTPKLSPAVPDHNFSAWSGRLQWGRRFPSLGSQLIARFEFQETHDVLLPMERFGLGGAYTVRGFRENQLLRDRGQLASIEYRHPLFGRESDSGWLVAPFLDYGRSTNRDGTTGGGPPSIAGAGVGLLWSDRQWNVQIYAAKGSRHFTQTDNSLQDVSIHFIATWNAF